MGLRIDRGGGRDGTARDCTRVSENAEHARAKLNSEELTIRRFPDVDLSASRPPGPMLLLRSFFLLAAAVEARPPGAPKSSMVAFSLSVALEGEKPVVDLRVRRVAGSAASCEVCDGAMVRDATQRILENGGRI